jgi:DNA-binding LacI/PurR family transcriptional regulator
VRGTSRLTGCALRPITVDNAAGVTLALDHLAALGHRRMAYLYEGHKPTSWEQKQRRAAYCRFMHAHSPTSKVFAPTLVRRESS